MPSPSGVVLHLVVAMLLAFGPAQAADDDIIIIDDVPFGSAPAKTADDAIIISDEPIVIVDEGEEVGAPPPRVTGPLGRVWETWHVAMDSELAGYGQLTQLDDGVLRGVASAWFETWILPVPNVNVYANAFARLASTTLWHSELVPVVDVYEAYAKLNVAATTVSLGRLVVPFGRTRGAALGDRLNPPDLRRGDQFPDPVRQKQPEWGASARTSIGLLGVEGIAFVGYEPTEGSLAAVNQGGLRIARYQTALARSPTEAGGLLREDNTAPLRGEFGPLTNGMLALRVTRRVGDFDLSGSIASTLDETPRLRLSSRTRRVLPQEAMALRGLPSSGSSACGEALSCLGGTNTLLHTRTTSASLDASWGLGVVILRAEAVAYPAAFGGRNSHLLTGGGLSSTRLSQFAGALSVEGALGDYVDGSIEVFDVMWADVPAGHLLYGVELLSEPASQQRQVHRVAGALVFSGKLLDERVQWRFLAETGFTQPDIQSTVEVRYRLPILNLYVGGRVDGFTGLDGSPGWMRQHNSRVGIFIGEGT